MKPVDWEKELNGINFDGLEPPPSFAERLAEEWRFNDAARLVVVGWPYLDGEGRRGALGALAGVAVSLLPEAAEADVNAIAKAVIVGLQRQAGAAFAAGDLPLASLAEFIGAALPQPTPKKAPPCRALRYPVEYYGDALRFTLKAWARRWWPGLDLEANYDRLDARRRRARRTARRRLDENPD
jgi:hypothetical protein